VLPEPAWRGEKLLRRSRKAGKNSGEAGESRESSRGKKPKKKATVVTGRAVAAIAVTPGERFQRGRGFKSKEWTKGKLLDM
jgi:hypothetical protein